MRRIPTAEDVAEVARDLPLRHATPDAWAHLTAGRLDVFLADHAICEQQAALYALNLVAHYPADDDLVDRMTALAAEEIHHMRRVCGLLRDRGIPPARRRPNPWVGALRAAMVRDREPDLKADRLLVGALIEARSCERFTRLLEVVEDDEVRLLLYDLGPAEKRHWRMFHDLAARELPAQAFLERWDRWLEIEREASAAGGVEPTVHG